MKREIERAGYILIVSEREIKPEGVSERLVRDLWEREGETVLYGSCRVVTNIYRLSAPIDVRN